MEYPKLTPNQNSLLILGHVNNPNFQRAKWLSTNIIGKRLSELFKPVHVCGLFDNEFQKQLWYFQHAIGGVFWGCHSEVRVKSDLCILMSVPIRGKSEIKSIST
uniref:Uncharacterized protein n=1 Tax=Cacopsylla melanoneura TaxID=428564 RepID=A0A8D9BZE3_9HEMI